MLMDLFFDSVGTEKKIRQHFHRFMQSIHARLAELSGKTDPLSIVVSELERDYDLICFDEFYVEDMPVTVAVDIHGESIHQNGPKRWRKLN